jgi:hypothetical protein
MSTYVRNSDESEREWCKELHQLTVGGSSAATASKSQATPSRMGNTSVNREHGSWQEELSPYLVPQEASQSHRSTTMTAQAGQTKKHDEKQDKVSNECDNGAESDALQVYRTVVAFQHRAEL